MNPIAVILISSLIFLQSTITMAESKTNAPELSSVSESRNQIIKFTDKGLVPDRLTIKKEDSIVFFLNDTTDSLTSLQIDFANKSTHCGGAKLQTGKNGVVSTIRPFGPNDFTSTCFHEAGEYPFTVYGLKSDPSGIKSSIIVE